MLDANGDAELNVIVDWTKVTSGDANGNGGSTLHGTFNLPLVATNSYDADGGRHFTSDQRAIPVGADMVIELYSGPLSSPVLRATYEGVYNGGGMITLLP